MHVLSPPVRSPVAPSVRADAERHWRGGLEHARAGRWKEAEKSYARAVRCVPCDPLYRVNLGQARRKLGDLDGAIEQADAALREAPGDTLATQLRLAVRLERHRFSDAIDDARQVAARPDAGPQAWVDYGVALAGAGRHRDAAVALMQAVARRPDCFDAYVLLCNAFDRMGLHAEAVESLRTALALRPGWGQGLGGVVYHALHGCDWSRLDEDLAALEAALALPGPHDFGPFMFLSFGAPAAVQRSVFEQHARLHLGAVEPLPPIAAAAPASHRRLRIGYLSSDFHLHATAVLLVEALERRDTARFEVRLYSHSVDDGSPLRTRIVAACDAFVDICGLSDREAAGRIRDDGIDVLVDLKGWTTGARTAIVAMRPAPIQVAWLGFPGTSGATFVDYAIVDPVVVPAACADEFTEKLAWLPDCYQPNDSRRVVGPPPGRAACGLPEDGVVLCCFNHTYKVRPQVFDVWCRLLRDVPDSVLWLLESNACARSNLEREAAARGVDPARLVFAPLAPHEAHLARLVHADLVLDTLPVNAHTTASDALWAGVPLLTCVGDAFVGRVAASLLHAVGLPELAVPDLAAYESLARTLALDPARRAALRVRLAQARLEAPLFDGTRFARELEALYERMAERHRAGLSPDHLPPRPVRAGGVGRAPQGDVR
jgi:predicted O-linked N-acetylglucosamine transferase (SPINDLY family)